MDYKPRNAFRDSYEDAQRYKKEEQRARVSRSLKTILRISPVILVVIAAAYILPSAFRDVEPLINILIPKAGGRDYWYVLLPVVIVFTAAIIGIASKNNSNIRVTSVSLERFQNLQHRLESLQKNVALYREAQRTLENSKVDILDDEGKKEIYDTIYSKIKNDASEDFLRGIENSIRTNVVLNDVKEYFLEMESRLFQRADSLNTTSIISLFIGITIATIGISILLYFVFNTDYEHAQKSVLIIEMLAKLGVSIGVEFLSFFFLNLYRKNLHEIKYIQNEMTNIEAKKISLLMAHELPVKYKFRIVNALSLTERNFVLDKGQTTVELEALKYEQKELYKMMKHSTEWAKLSKEK